MNLDFVLGAYLSKGEDIKGSIEAGKLAEMIILDKGILSIPVEEIKDMCVSSTIVGGKVVYSR